MTASVLPEPASVLPEPNVRTSGTRLKVVDAVMELPIIHDAASAASALAAPYASSLSPVVGAVNLMCSTAEGQMSSGLKETVGSAVENLDSMACSGLDQLTERLPSLAVSTPELMARTKDAVSDCMLMPNLYFTVATEFIASLAIVQLLLRSTDVVLGKVETTVPSVPVLGLRRSARALRRSGRRKTSAPGSAGEKATPTQSIGDASLLGALADIFCVNFFLAWVGLQMVPAERTVHKKRSTRRRQLSDLDEEVEEAQKFGDLDFSKYDSALDADYSPSELSGEDDPLEYDSQTEEPEPRFVEEAEAEVVEGDLGEEADSVEIKTEEYNSKGIKTEEYNGKGEKM